MSARGARRKHENYYCPGGTFCLCINLRPGHTAFCVLITAKARPKVVTRGADDVVRVEAEFKTSYGRFVDVVGREIWKSGLYK